MSKGINRIKSGMFERRLAVGLSGLKAGATILGNRASTFLMNDNERNKARSETLEREARKFCRELGKLKGSYVKIGQTLALLGEHLLPSELTSALHELESNTQALPWDAVQHQIKHDLGAKYEDLEIERCAFAAASIGQVHRAQHRLDGRQICLKVQYPGVAATIDSDFDDVIRLLKLSRWLPNTQDLSVWMEEVRQMLHQEVDYRLEAIAMQKTASRLENDARFHVPKLYTEYSSQTLLAMEYVDGHRVDSAFVKSLPQIHRDALGASILDLFFIELYQWGELQTDPNFGNYLVSTINSQPQLVLLDFGAHRSLPAQFLQALRRTIAATLDGNEKEIHQGLIDLNFLSRESPLDARQSFARFCKALLEPLQADFKDLDAAVLTDSGSYDWANSLLMKRAGKVGIESTKETNFALPAKEFAFIVRKLSGVFTIICSFGSCFNGHEAVMTRVQQWRDQNNTDRVQ